MNKEIAKNIKAKFLKSKKNFKKNFKNFFDWVKGAELIELKECETSKDPVRPELDNEFRTSYGRKIFGVKFKDEIHAVMCFAFTNKIPKTVKELDLLSKDAFLNHLYGGIDEPEPKIIDVFMCKLRRKIADASASGVVIDTIWGQGYIFREVRDCDTITISA